MATAKRKASSSSLAVDNLQKRRKHTLTNSKNSAKQSANTAPLTKPQPKMSANTAPLTKPQPKMSTGTASNHSDAVSCIVAPGYPLKKPCEHVASKVHGKTIKFKYGEVYSCQNAEIVHHDCTTAYCKDCFAQLIQGLEDKSASKKSMRARGSSTTTATCCEHSNSSSYKASNKDYVTTSRYNDGTHPLPTHCAGCGGEFV